MVNDYIPGLEGAIRPLVRTKEGVALWLSTT
jgi:hypothetical protein